MRTRLLRIVSTAAVMAVSGGTLAAPGDPVEQPAKIEPAEKPGAERDGGRRSDFVRVIELADKKQLESRQRFEQGDVNGAVDAVIEAWRIWRTNPKARRSSLAAFIDMEHIVMHEPTAKTRFRAIRPELEAELAADPASQQARLEWVNLNMALGDDDLVLEWVDAGMPGLALPQNDDEARTSDMFLMQMNYLLARTGRWAALSRLIHDPMRTAKENVRIFGLSDPMRHSTRPDPQRGETAAAQWEMSRYRNFASLYAALLAGGRDAEAEKVAAYVMTQLPSGWMKVALVEQARQAGRPRAEHLAWLDEAKAQGSELPGLRAQVEGALAKTTP